VRRRDPEVSILKLMLRAAIVSMLAIPLAFAFAQAPAGKPRAKSAAPTSTPAAPVPKPAAAPSRSPASAGPSGSASARLDGIAAVVNDDVILESDVEEQLYLFLAQARMRPDSMMVDSMRNSVLNQLIDFRIVVAEAKRQGLSLSANDEEADRAAGG